MKKDRTSATASPGLGEWRQKGVALLPGLSYCLWKATHFYLLQVKKLAWIYVFWGPKNLCMCVSKVEEEVSTYCTGAFLTPMFGMSSVWVRSSELSRGLSMQTSVLYISWWCFSALLILHHCENTASSSLYLRATSFYSELPFALCKHLGFISCKSLPRHKIPPNLGFILEEVWCAVEMATVKIWYQYWLICD